MFKVEPAQDILPPQHGIKNYFAIQKCRFNALGIDPTSMERTIFNSFLLWIPMFALIMLCIFMLLYVAENRHNMDLITEILATFCQSILSFIKILCFMWNKKKIVKLVRHIWLWNLEAQGEELLIIAEENGKDYNYSLLFQRWVLITIFMALVSPVLLAYLYHLKGYGFMDSINLPLKAAYGIIVDPKSYKGYLFAYFWNVVAIYLIFNGAISNDTLFSWFAHNVSAQFCILKLNFKQLATTATLQNNEDKFIKSLILCTEYHYRVIDVVNDFNEVFRTTVFFKYTISFFQIGCLVFQISRSAVLSSVVYHILFLMAVSLQLMLYCQGGQRIIDESTSVAAAIYDYFPWHEMSIKARKYLLLSMIRAQKPCVLTGIFFVADLRQFLWAFKTSGSLFTMLISVDSKENAV